MFNSCRQQSFSFFPREVKDFIYLKIDFPALNRQLLEFYILYCWAGEEGCPLMLVNLHAAKFDVVRRKRFICRLLKGQWELIGRMWKEHGIFFEELQHCGIVITSTLSILFRWMIQHQQQIWVRSYDFLLFETDKNDWNINWLLLESKCTLHFKHPVFSLPEFQTAPHWKETGVDDLPSTFRNKAFKKRKKMCREDYQSIWMNLR